MPPAIRLYCWTLALWLTGGTGIAVWSENPPLPEPFEGEVNFARDIAPLLQSRCVKCHGQGKRKGGFNLDNRDNLLQAADSGPAVQPGNSTASYLVELIAGVDSDNVMPQKGTRLTAEQVGLIRTWIDRGLPWDESISFAKKPSLNLQPRRPDFPGGNFRFPPMHPVDAFVSAYFEEHDFAPPDPIDDRTFLRRAWLDVLGLLPPVDAVNDFPADPRHDKRNRLLRELLADRKNYAEHWMSFWNDLLRNDYRGTGFIDGGREQISPWLYRALAENRPYDEFVRSLITGEPGAEGFAKGIVWRGVVNASQQPAMQAAQNVSQVFLGVNLKCASCHDSFINDWTLDDAYGMAGIFADGPLEIFECDKPSGRQTPVKYLYAAAELSGEAADRQTRVHWLADQLTGRENGRLSRTIVNRLWSRFFGRGLVPTLDDMEQPSWHPDLLDWLATDLVDHDYDLKHTIELLLSSRAYQLPSRPRAEVLETSTPFRGPLVRRMTAEQLVDALGSFSGKRFTSPTNNDIDLSAGIPEDRKDQLRETIRRARWITADRPGPSDDQKKTVVFRKRFRIDRLPRSTEIYVAAADAFELSLNGKRVGKGQGRDRAFRFNVGNRIVFGNNLIALQVSGPDNGDWPATRVLLRLADDHRNESESRHLGSDDSWIFQTGSPPRWKHELTESYDWRPAVALPEDPFDDEPALISQMSAARQRGKIRASLVVADPLTRALGRPNREQVITDRASQATTLQALELTNGQTLADRLKLIAADLIAQSFPSPEALVERLFLTGLGRSPSAAELTAHLQFFEGTISSEAVEDSLWCLVMLPEFQLIL